VHEEVVMAVLAGHLPGGVSGNLLGAPVPEGNLPLAVDEVDAVVDAVKKLSVETLFQPGPLRSASPAAPLLSR